MAAWLSWWSFICKLYRHLARYLITLGGYKGDTWILLEASAWFITIVSSKNHFLALKSPDTDLRQGYYCCNKTSQRKQLEEESRGGGDLFGLHLYVTVPDPTKSEQDLKHGQTLEPGGWVGHWRCYLMTCFLWFAQPALLQNPGPSAQQWHHP